MIRIILTLFLVSLLCCGEKESNTDIIELKWKVGDLRFFNEKGEIFVRTGADTIANSKYEKILKVTVVENVGNDYVIEITLQPLKVLELTTTVDSLSDLSDRVNNALNIVKDFTKFNVPYKVRVSGNGVVMDIVDFDDYLAKYMDTILGIRDTISISEEETETLKKFNQTKGTIAEQLQMAIGKESSELLAIYNIKNPVNGDIVEETTMPNPKTGEPLPTTLTYHLRSFKDDIQEIELNIKISEPLNELLTDTTTENETKQKVDYGDMVNSTIYFFNDKTGWLESSTSTVVYNSDTFEVRMRSEINVQQ